MCIKNVGDFGSCPVFITHSDEFSIQDFAFNHCYSLSPMLIVKGEPNQVYQFTHAPRAGDIISQWDNGGMKPCACISDEECNALFEISDSEEKGYLKEPKIRQLLKHIIT